MITVTVQLTSTRSVGCMIVHWCRSLLMTPTAFRVPCAIVERYAYNTMQVRSGIKRDSCWKCSYSCNSRTTFQLISLPVFRR